MNSSLAPQPKLQLNKEQVVAGAIMIGVGGVLALAGAALAGTALAIAFRLRVQQMEVPPSELARQHWSAVKHGATAGVNVWLKEQPAGSASRLRTARHPARAGPHERRSSLSGAARMTSAG